MMVYLQACRPSPGFGEFGEEIQDEVLIPSVQQSVCFVQNEELDSAQAQLPTLHQILYSACMNSTLSLRQLTRLSEAKGWVNSRLHLRLLVYNQVQSSPQGLKQAMSMLEEV